MKLIKSVNAISSHDFKQVLKDEIQQLAPNLLPLQQGLSLSSYVSDQPFSVTILNIIEENQTLHIKAGIFYTGIIAGCSCADDPNPQDEQNEYCEVEFIIEKKTGETQASLLSE